MVSWEYFNIQTIHFIAVTGAANTFQDSDYYEYSDKIKEYSDQIAFDTVSIALVLPIFW